MRVSALCPLFVLSGCASVTALRPYPPPRAAEVVAHLLTRTERVVAVRSRAKADYLDEGQRIKLSIAAIAAPPEQLRLDGENTLTGPLLTLATDGKQFQLLDVRKNQFLAGPVTPCNMARLLRVELSSREVVAVLLGGATLLPSYQSAELRWDGRKGGREVLILHGERGQVEVLWLSAKDRAWDVEQAELRDASGHTLWRIQHESFSWFQAADARVRLPAVTYIEDPMHKSDVRLRWKEREINPVLSPGFFRLEPPQGLPTIPAACGG